MIIKVDTKLAPGTLRDMIRGPEQRETCGQLSEFFIKVAGGLVEAKVSVELEERAEVAKPAPAKKKASSVSSKKKVAAK